MSDAARPLLHPRDEVVQTMERIYRYRMTTTSGGNLSVRDENGGRVLRLPPGRPLPASAGEHPVHAAGEVLQGGGVPGLVAGLLGNPPALVAHRVQLLHDGRP